MEKIGSKKEEFPSLTFERATEKDAEMFLDLERSALDSPTYSPTTDPAEALEELEKNVVYFIREGDEIVGSVMYQMKAPDHAYISGLIVRPDYQGRGIGREAMIKVLEELKGVPTIDLVTHPDNARAIQLYESLGFTIGERLENHFDDGEPRVVMTLKR
jgi:ribosomal protein S18 acetylase RimI-like enzyme